MLFLDMDGVLAQYDRNDYIGDPMPFEIPNTHYFAKRPVGDGAPELLHTAEEITANARTQIVVLTTLGLGAQRDRTLEHEHKSDKVVWLQQLCKQSQAHLPPILFARAGKIDKPTVARSYLRRPIGSCDILIDDFNDNLATWAASGGTAVKWINEHNNPDSWPGLVLDTTCLDAAKKVLTKILCQQKPKPYAKQQPLFDLI